MAAHAKRPVWLDVDPGHDDAFALLLAGYSPSLRLIGVSTTHGNQSLAKTTANALSMLHAAGLSFVPVVAGAAKPLMRPAVHCPSIHGDTGLDSHEDGVTFPPLPADRKAVGSKFVNYCFHCLKSHFTSHGERVTFVATGCLTNLALLLSVYPEVAEVVEEIVIMGGSTGRGNTGPAAEFNIQIDPEAAAIVFGAGIPLTMVPLDVTHTTLVTDAVLQAVAVGPPPRPAAGGGFTASLARLPSITGAGASPASPTPNAAAAVAVPGDAIPPRVEGALAAAASPFRKLLVSLLSFFAATYDATFGMPCPPLHDPVAVLMASLDHRALFKTRKCRVDIETTSRLSAGQTVVDLLNVGNHPPEALNATVALAVDVPAFWKAMLDAITAADARSPLNPAPAFGLSAHSHLGAAMASLPPLGGSLKAAASAAATSPASARDGLSTPSRAPVLPPIGAAPADAAPSALSARDSVASAQLQLGDGGAAEAAARPATQGSTRSRGVTTPLEEGAPEHALDALVGADPPAPAPAPAADGDAHGAAADSGAPAAEASQPDAVVDATAVVDAEDAIAPAAPAPVPAPAAADEPAGDVEA